MKKTIIAVMLLLLSIGMLNESFNIPSIKAEESIYISSEGTVYPQTAPIERDGDIYSFTANISGHVVVQRNNAVVDGKWYSLEGEGTGNGFDLSNINNVTVKNAKISRFSTGINLYHSVGATLVNNTITKCVYGILPSSSPDSTISANIVAGNFWDGIFLTYSDRNIIDNNIIANHSKWGLYLGSSTGIILRNNKISGNAWNFAVSDKFVHDIDDSNTINGKPIYYLVNQHDKQVSANAGYVAAVNSTNIIIRNVNLTDNGQGIVLVNSKNCLIENSFITKMGYYAIQLVNADDNTISNNNITSNRPPYFGVGIAVQRDSTGNTIRNNIIQNNELGILFYNSGANIIYHNNFIGNAEQVDSIGSTNIWDSGYPSGGNYWSNYAGTDEKSGSDQAIPGKDGIGDTPHIIDETNRDRYPFMSMIPKESGNATISIDPTEVLIEIAIIVAVTVLACFLGTRTRASKKLEKISIEKPVAAAEK